MYFHISWTVVWQQEFVDTCEFPFRFQKVTKLKILVSCQAIRVAPANTCLCVQAAINKHLPYPENHQSADCAPPRATRLLWLPHQGWWQRLKNASPSAELLGFFFLQMKTYMFINHLCYVFNLPLTKSLTSLFLYRLRLTIVHTVEK